MFLFTLQVSKTTLDRAWSKERTRFFEDGGITDHIPPNQNRDTGYQQLPKYQNHYARAENHPDTMYIPQGLLQNHHVYHVCRSV